MQLRFVKLRRAALFAGFILMTVPTELLAQGGSHDLIRGGGGYLSLTKIGLIALVFLIWVRCADWINRDSMKLGKDTDLQPEIWNPISVSTFLIGFLAAISVPMFVAGYPIFVLAALTPPMIYWLIRRSKIKSMPGLALKAKAKVGTIPVAQPLPQDDGAIVEFIPAGDESKERQVNLIRARQTPEDGFTNLKDLIDQGLNQRADQVLIDYTREQAAGRVQVDGSWHPLPVMDRLSGDALLASLKYLAGLNPQDRRSAQQGVFRAISPNHKCDLEVLTQGTQTGERVQMKFHRKVKNQLTIIQLGMWPEMSKRLAEFMNAPGLTIISALPMGGLTSTWQAALDNSDRITRDCVGLVDVHSVENDMENITQHRFNMAEGQSPISILKAILLTQPDCLVVPDVVNSESLDALTFEAITQDRSVFCQAQAQSAAEALLQLYSLSKNRQQFAQAVTAVTNQRLLRRLCDNCKVEVQVQPQIIQQLGGDPREQTTVHTQYKLPPPDQRVDEKGKPIEFPTCKVCSGIGYVGRIAVFELLEITDNLRQVLMKQPTSEAIEKSARAEGKTSLIAEGYKLVLLGLTSIAEVQRVLKS